MKTLLFIFLITLSFSSCSDTENMVTDNQSDNRNIDFTEIGRIHNEGLDYVFSKLSLPPRTATRADVGTQLEIDCQRDLLKQVNELCCEYITKQINESDDAAQNAYLLYGGEKQFKEDTETIKTLNIGRMDVQVNISSIADSYIDKIGELLNNTSLEVSDLQLQLSQLESEAQNILTTDIDRNIILPAIAVAKSSSIYWDENDNKWGNKCGYVNYKLKGLTRSSIWKSDVGGAVGFGLHMCLNGSAAAIASTGPSGWLSLAVILGGAALESSAIALLCEMKYVDEKPVDRIFIKEIVTPIIFPTK